MKLLQREPPRKGKAYGLYLCNCGKEFVTRLDAVKSGMTRSCGCLHKKFLASGNARRSHGLSKTRIWNIHQDMVRRTTKEYRKDYNRYGGRGITCEWDSFESFIEDMYKSYLAHVEEYGEKQTTLDRIDNNGNYNKKNCRWATMTEQANNTRSNKVITHNGRTMTYTQWEHFLELPRDTVHRRMKCGYPIKKALSKENYGNK